MSDIHALLASMDERLDRLLCNSEWAGPTFQTVLLRGQEQSAKTTEDDTGHGINSPWKCVKEACRRISESDTAKTYGYSVSVSQFPGLRNIIYTAYKIYLSTKSGDHPIAYFTTKGGDIMCLTSIYDTRMSQEKPEMKISFKVYDNEEIIDKVITFINSIISPNRGRFGLGKVLP